MTPKSTSHVIQGMQKDTSKSKLSREFAFDAKNIRITAREDNTLLTITNEKGTKTLNGLFGYYLGHCVLNNQLVLFIKAPNAEIKDRIFLYDSEFKQTTLYSGNLSFSLDNPIEALGVYENEYIQKVYWVDGINQPRVINIAAEDKIKEKWTDSSFDFIPELTLQESVSIEAISNPSMFAPGVIQYAFSYYNKNGQESNIFNTTPLCYIAHENRGGSPEEIITNRIFKISIENYDESFDYIRVYSIHRTSLDAVPTVKIVTDYYLKDSKNSKIEIYDNGIYGETIDPTLLLYTGGENIIAGSITHKDGTLFLGNINLPKENIVESDILNSIYVNKHLLEEELPSNYNEDKYYFNNNVLNNLTYFSTREIYRIGVQFQYKNGKWSRPYFIKDYTITNNLDIQDDIIKFPSIKISISSTIHSKLSEKNIVRYRALVVFPNTQERVVLDRGVVCPTLYNQKDRENNNPYNQSSWFFRSVRNSTTAEDLSFNNSYSAGSSTALNALIEFRDNHPLFSYGNRGSEIQNETDFFVDYSVLTYHSPFVEFNEDNINLEGVKARIIGYIPIQETYGRTQIQTSSSPYSKQSDGFIPKDLDNTKNGQSLVSDFFYLDTDYDEKDSVSPTTEYLIYPWHRKGSLNYDNATLASNASRTQSAVLKNKQLSNFRRSSTINYIPLTSNNISEYEIGISNIQKFNGSSIRIPRGGGNYINYFGDYKKLLFDANKKYPIYIRKNKKVNTVNSSANTTDGVLLEYKSTPHYVLSLTYDCIFPYTLGARTKKVIDHNGNIVHSRECKVYSSPTVSNLTAVNLGEVILIKNENDSYYTAYMKVKEHDSNSTIATILANYYVNYEGESQILFSSLGNSGIYKYNKTKTAWERLITSQYEAKNTSVFFSDTNVNVLYVIELYREANTNLLFGGTSDAAKRNNIWLPASKSVNIEDPAICEYGDTRYQRYDCLKTYAYSPESENQVIDVLSFMCETRINMLGRYDKNIGNLSNLYADPTNFNLFNPVYSQKDNFFNYRILDSDMYKLNNFPNTITWSKEKHAGEDIDSWTNITMASTLDLDGNKGEIKKLIVHSNRILAFQEKGIAEVLFNSRVQIPTSDGVPIEITNGYKVEGFRYISDGVGSKNKNSITVTPSGVYFLDSNSNSIYLLTDGLTNLSTEKGFEIWTKKVANDSSFKTFYDTANKDVYFTTKYECLGYSEKLGQFTSFYDYNDVETMFNMGTELYSIKADSGGSQAIYQHSIGNYNEFYGEIKPYHLTIISNEDPQVDKVFTTLDYRADFFDSDNNYLENESFDTIKVWNEYQEGEETLKYSKFKPSNLKKKFRMWGANIPRDKKNKLDRMRNPWLYIKLSKKDENSYKMELHDIVVKYLE